VETTWLLEGFECCREWLDGVRLGKPGVCFAEKRRESGLLRRVQG
jgi:hypothetical protein